MPEQIKLLRSDPADADRPRSLERESTPADPKSRDAAEWEQVLRHPRRVSWRQAAEMMGTVRLMAADRVASERRRPW